MSTFVMTAAEETRFNELMKASYRKVFNMAYRLSGTRPDAEDLTQEAYYRAYRSFEDYEGDRPFENWIFRIVTKGVLVRQHFLSFQPQPALPRQ